MDEKTDEELVLELALLINSVNARIADLLSRDIKVDLNIYTVDTVGYPVCKTIDMKAYKSLIPTVHVATGSY